MAIKEGDHSQIAVARPWAAPVGIGTIIDRVIHDPAPLYPDNGPGDS